MEDIAAELQQFGYSVVRQLESNSKLYRILEVHPKGSQKLYVCKVYSNMDEDLHQLIKEAFDAEVSNAAVLNEIYTSRFIEKFQTKFNNYLIYNYSSSETLSKYIQRTGIVKQEMRRKIFQQLLIITELLHSAGVAHHRIEPENILISNSGMIKLINFEFSKLYNYYEKSEAFSYSSAFTAPEVLSGEKYDPFKADIWSIGVIVYFMATGKNPFVGKNYEEALKSINETKLSIPHGCDRNLYSTIIRCMRIIPDQRPTINELKLALRRVHSLPLPNLGVKKIVPLARNVVTSSSYSRYTRN